MMMFKIRLRRTFGDDYADGDDDGRLGVKKRTG